MSSSSVSFAVLPQLTNILSGGLNTAALAKFTQQHEDADKLKIAVVAKNGTYINPQAYFGVVHSHIKKLKLEAGSLSSQVEPWSKIDAGVSVTKVDPNANKDSLDNGKEYSYKALVLNTGFDHSSDYIKGLDQFEWGHESNNVFVHALDNKERTDRNWYTGYNLPHGDLICYSPAFPYKGEGSDFYALYYESFLVRDKLHTVAAKNARVQYWTPNKEIFQFPYANEVALDECHKRGIDVMFGWEMLEVKQDSADRKIAVFRNVDTGEVIDKDFTSAIINPPSKTHSFLTEAGLVDNKGGIDVNKYTLQHKKHENIFAFGDAIGGDLTRTMTAAQHQNPVVKNNLLNYLHGREVNAVYDGYTFIPFLTGHTYASSFQHKHDWEPTALNHAVSHYGIFGNRYYKRLVSSQQKIGEKYGSFKKNHGPPHWHYPATYDALEHNQYLASKGVDLSEVRHANAQAKIVPETA